MLVRILFALFVLSLANPSHAADSDLQQYNRAAVDVEAVCGANPLTSSLLLVRDGKLITADANGVFRAPINRSVRQLAEYMACTRCMVSGSCAGVNLRTLKSLHIDGTGGLVSSATSNTMKVSSGAGVTEVGPGGVQITASGGGYHQMADGYSKFTGTVAGGGNPAMGAPISNEVRPINIVKAWFRVTTDGLGNISIIDGHNIASCSIGMTNTIDCTMSITLDSTNYVALANGQVSAVTAAWQCSPQTGSTMTCIVQPVSGPTLSCATNQCVMSVIVVGRLTT